MDWFERLFGFREGDYEATRQRLAVEGNTLRSRVNARAYGIGELELVSLQTLRDRIRDSSGMPGKLRVSIVRGDVRQMHQEAQNAGALFQVASQFNLLEMVGPDVTPEQGVTRYQFDGTQGPACAMAAGAATVYRNYFAHVGAHVGQTHDCQLDGLADLGVALSSALGRPVDTLWAMRNGYAMCHQGGLEAINVHLASLSAKDLDALRAKLRIGVHRDVEVTDAASAPGPMVSQAFCSALPVRYSSVAMGQWRAFANLVLEAAYEATLLAAIENAQRGRSNVVLLTRLGGGAFGNHDDWIHESMRRALLLAKGFDLDVRVVSYGKPSPDLLDLVRQI